MRRLNKFLPLLTTVLSVWTNIIKVAESKPKSSYQDTKVCTGSNTGLHHSDAGKPWDRYLSYLAKYGNCTTIQENVEILFLDGDHYYDMSFLESIRVVNGYVLIYGNFFDTLSMKNLRVIRGQSLYTPTSSNESYSLYVSTNYKNGTTEKGLKEVHFTSLHEILKGEILFERNNLLCYAQKSINWMDILSSRTTPTFKEIPEGQRQCSGEQCHSDCTFNSTSRYCWGPTADLCQRITSLVCASNCEHRCFGPEATQCCDSQCAGGCGTNKYDCWVCRHSSNYGECVETCPGEKIYNIKTYKYEDNPDVRYTYGANCVKQCPSYMLIEDGACVSKCTDGFTAGPDRKCKRCENGICPKTCVHNHSHITNANIASYEGCTIIEGSITIVKATFDTANRDAITNMSVLNALENVHEISGYLLVQGNHTNFTSLSFLRNLRVIYGRKLVQTASFAITGTSLEELELRSLREISHGSVIILGNRRLKNLGLVSLEKVAQSPVKIIKNPQLCYADTINWTQIVVGSGTPVLLSNNANRTQDCEPKGFVCSDQCSADDGCWGQAADECRFCAHYLFDQTCVSSCSFKKGLYPETDNGTNECLHCDEQCLDDCTGEGSDKCLACKNVKDGAFCRDKCPPQKFVSANGTCESCYEHCKGSCSGKESYFGPGGCSDCHLMIDLDNGRNECFAEGSECPSNFYSFKTSYQIGGKKSPSVDGCRRCDSQCKTCQSSGTSLKKDHCECVNFVSDDHCVETCSPAHYSDADRRCIKCHHECLECYGPSAAECSLCRNYRLYDDDDDDEEDSPLEDGQHAPNSNSSFFGDNDRFLNDTGSGKSKERFNCTDVCPEWMNGKETLVVGTHHQTACRYEAAILASTSEDHKTTVVLPVVIGIIAIGLIAIVVVFLKRQWAKSEENKLRIAARMNGLEIEEIITPTDAKPDVSTLRLIKETELRRGSEIGSGAFGTVFKGIWIPTGENVKIPVAIKVLTESSNASLNVELLEEARIMASVTHPCCIRILAVCMTAQMMLVTQLMPLGSLLDYLRKNRSSIGSNALLKWSAQIARGMKYLEERGIVHRDLAARNVLVQGTGQVRITDFGLAKLLNINEEQYQATGGKMPIKWLALESIQHRVFTHKSDVWSYGVTLWELFTYGDRPYEGIRAVDMAHHLEMGERLSQPAICTIDVYMIMIKCWMVDAESRPGFSDLEVEFANMSKDPGRYLVIQGDRFMRLQSVAEDSASPTDWFRTLSMEDEEVGPEKLMTADEYLRPQDLLDFHPLGSRYLQNMNSITEENNYENNCKRLTSVDSSAPSSPSDVFKFDDLEEAAAAKKLKSSSSSSAKGRDRKHSIRYTSDPCRDDEVGSNGPSSPVPLTGTDAAAVVGSKGKELMCFTDEADYLQPRSSANLTHCPNYLDVVDDSGIAEVKQLEHQTRMAGNPEYFLQNDVRSDPWEREALLQNGSKERRPKDDYSYLSTTDVDTYMNNNNHKDSVIKKPKNAPSLNARPVYANL